MDRPDTRAVWDANAPAWIELTRGGFDLYRDLVNTPAFLRMLPDVHGLRCLDLGCGEGHNTRQLAGLGGEVVRLDISQRFVRAASETADERVRYVLGDGAVLPFASASFDVVAAFMSLMDVADPERTLHEIARVLTPGGVVQFSIVHPLTSTPRRAWVEGGSGERIAMSIGEYFFEGPMHESWTFGSAPAEILARTRPFEITYARRTLAGWLNAVVAAGLCITALDEPHADEATATAHPEVADTRIVPHSLVVQAHRS